MKKSYEQVKIGELLKNKSIIDLQDGNHGEMHPKSKDYIESGIPFVMANNFVYHNVDLDGAFKISKDTADKLRIGFSKDGDVLLTHKGTIGNTAIVENADPYIMLTPQVTYYRVDNSKLNNYYLLYCFTDPLFQKTIKSLAQQSTRPYIGITAQKKLSIRMRKIDDQLKIVLILKLFDDLLTLNRRRIQLLEESARLLFREWFVYFRFPGYEKVKIVDGVPEGWKKAKVKDLGNIITGKTPSKRKPRFFNGAIPFVKTPDMHKSFIIIKTEELLSELGANSQNKKYLPPWSVLVSCIGTVGVVAMNLFRSQTNQQINSVISKKEIYRYYSFFCLSRMKLTLQAIGGGSTMANVNKNKFENLSVNIPPDAILKSFDQLVDPAFKQVVFLLQQNQNLAQARDLLLPRLMSGEIEV